MNIKAKFVLVSIVIFTLSTIGFSVYMYREFTDTYLQQMDETNQQLLERLSYNLDTYLDEVYRLTLIPYYNRSVMELLVHGKPENLREKLEKRNVIQDFLDTAIIYRRKDIQRVLIVADDRYFTYREYGYFPSYEELIESGWYKDSMNSHTERVYLPDELDPLPGKNTPLCFSVVRSICDLSDKACSLLLRILVVDDEKLTRDFLALKVPEVCEEPCKVRCACNGKEALEVLEEEEADVVITDIKMPQMDGLELSGRIRREYPQTSIIILSGYSEFEYAQQAFRTVSVPTCSSRL